VSTAEIFGPVVCVYPYDDLDQAITVANSLPVAFQAAVFSRNIDSALRVYRRLDASAVMINDHTAFRVDGMPFAGLRESGLGVGGIPHTIADMQIEKMLVLRSAELNK
jgi:acyl-CoA reductase-like NAD-dependent aldehyde dehydrogenase